MHLYLIRHGQSYINLPDWDGDEWDQPLTPLGERQAEAVSKWVAANVAVRHLYASTLLRTQQTARVLSTHTGLECRQEDRIREVGSNAADGAPIPSNQLGQYIEGLWGSLNPYDQLTPNGENWMQFRARVGSFIESLLRSFDSHEANTPATIAEQSVLVVCHGGVIEACFEYVFEKGPWSVVSVMSSNTGITHLQYRPVENRPEWRLHYHNRLEHLASDHMSHGTI